jgi:NNP family nitrate/nitrite transporter-like MFS transporter
MNHKGPSSFLSLSLILLVGIFYLNFISRIALAPFLPIVEIDLGLGHGEAGSLFFYAASGYAGGLLASGYITARIVHHRMITLSAGMLGLAMVALSLSRSLAALQAGLFFVGVFTGFYLPSGIAVLTGLFPRNLWGRIMAVHELAPNIAFITAPLLAEGLLNFFSWRSALGMIGAGSFLIGILFMLFGRGGSEKGAPPNLRSMRAVLARRQFWTMAVYFIVAIGASLGLYNMLSLFLVSDIPFARETANLLIGVSRISASFALLLSGFLTDRLGAKKAMMALLLVTGLSILLLGLFRGPGVTGALLFLQAASVVCLFPIGFTMVSFLFPSELRSVAVSLIIFLGSLFGGGLIPAALGHWAEGFSFSSGFVLLGLLFLALLPFFQWSLRDAALPK